MDRIKFQSGESLIDSWILNFTPQGGGRFTGNLFVTNLNLYFDAHFDNSFTGFIESLNSFYKKDLGYFVIPKSEIEDVQTLKKMFVINTIHVTTKNEGVFVFDYGMLDVTKILEAIRN